MRKGMYERLLSDVDPKEWIQVASKHYRHKTGVQVKYDHNRWAWQVIGGVNCGRLYETKWQSQTEAVKGL